MPKDIKEDSKKKLVVVEEIADPQIEAETPKKNEETEVNSDAKVNFQDEETQPESKKQELDIDFNDQEDKPNYLWIIIPTALLIGALVGGLITYFSGLSKINVNNSTPSPVSTSTPVSSAVPSATPSSTLKKDELKVQILNGSGVSGAAGKAKTLLEAAGYKDIDTGNASVSNLAQTQIEIKAENDEFLDILIKDLEKSYAAVEAEKPLAASSKYDVVITIGKK